VGEETNRVKEAKSTEQEEPAWGPVSTRAILWEAATALGLMEAGGELLVMRNPEALAQVKEMAGNLWARKK
jgi:acetyl-CoA decarbonylase/synthase complex subunit delta